MRNLRSTLRLISRVVLALCFAGTLEGTALADLEETRGVFLGISTAGDRLKGAKKNFQVWAMKDQKGANAGFAMLESTPSIKEVLSNPKAFIGKKCVVQWYVSDESLNNYREPVTINVIRSVRWETTSAKPTDATPKGIAEGIYGLYKAVGPESAKFGFDLRDAKLMRSLFRADLATAIMADMADGDKRNDSPKLNFDPFLEAQDCRLENLEVKVAAQGKAAAVVCASFKNMGESAKMYLDFSLTTDGWRIADIRGRNSLRKMYRMKPL